MEIVPTLLRLILALSLFLNGTGTAAAHADPAEAHARIATGVGVATVDEVPCHEASVRSDPGHDSHDGKTHGDGASTGMHDHQAGADCCDTGTCETACPQSLSAALVAAVVTGVNVPPEAHSQPVPATRPGPVLPHPIRPPIA